MTLKLEGTQATYIDVSTLYPRGGDYARAGAGCSDFSAGARPCDRRAIRKGLPADLALVEGDSTHDILATCRIVAVWKGCARGPWTLVWAADRDTARDRRAM